MKSIFNTRCTEPLNIYEATKVAINTTNNIINIYDNVVTPTVQNWIEVTFIFIHVQK